MNIADWIKPEIKNLSAYHVPAVSDVVKLDAMENPYAWPQELVAQWLNRLRDAQLNRYPDPHANALKQSLRANMAIPEEMALILGNGSDELIQLILMAVAAPGRSVLAPEPTFVMYRMIATVLGLNYSSVPLKADYQLDLDSMLQMIKDTNPAVVFLAYPNNPTGNLFASEDIWAIIDASNGLVVVDEAYFAFTSNTFMNELANCHNLMVMRTLSKMGLAGLRLGYLVGHPDWIGELEKIRLPYNINVLTQASAEFALEHINVLDEQSRQIVHDRDQLNMELQTLPGITVYPSSANFVLFAVSDKDAGKVFLSLLEQGVLIKNMSDSSPYLSACLRVTVGTTEENQKFLAALKCSLS